MDVRQVVSAYLPNLKYYNYTHISTEEREEATKEFSRELRELNERESQEITRQREQEVLANERIHHFECFIENLEGHDLFNKLFEGDDFSFDTDRMAILKSEYVKRIFLNHPNK